ncbi:unnamed protein product [Protopolystoma xenopodis]|uniref:Uncharacterized protein n=1 Tax=Protopolystoma xenopodis TaxID=117903 RepID=A0A448X5G0_9PLAT|nr:unnamed protein product [Protopolystoma xenopodis]
MIHHLTNWFTFFCCPRTLANSLEWTFSTLGLSLYPCLRAFSPQKVYTTRETGQSQVLESSETTSLESDRSGVDVRQFGDFRMDSVKFLPFIFICLLIRPTACIIWVPLCLYHVFMVARHKR